MTQLTLPLSDPEDAHLRTLRETLAQAGGIWAQPLHRYIQIVRMRGLTALQRSAQTHLVFWGWMQLVAICTVCYGAFAAIVFLFSNATASLVCIAIVAVAAILLKLLHVPDSVPMRLAEYAKKYILPEEAKEVAENIRYARPDLELYVSLLKSYAVLWVYERRPNDTHSLVARHHSRSLELAVLVWEKTGKIVNIPVFPST